MRWNLFLKACNVIKKRLQHKRFHASIFRTLPNIDDGTFSENA